VTLPQYWLYGR